MRGDVLGQSASGVDINGIIKEYEVASGGNVNAGDFVKFINSYPVFNNNITQIIDKGGNLCSPFFINENKIIILHNDVKEDINLYATICTISGNSISAGVTTKLTNLTAKINDFNAFAINDNKIFVAYSDRSSTGIKALICTISDTTITKETSSEILIMPNINTEEFNNIAPKLALIDNNKILLMANDKITNYIKSCICTISDNSISSSPVNDIIECNKSSNSIELIKINTNKAVLFFTDKSDYSSICATVCTVSESTVSIGSIFFMTNNHDSSVNAHFELLETNKIIATYHRTNYNGIVAFICSINGNKIEKLNECILGIGKYELIGDNLILINPKSFLVATYLLEKKIYSYSVENDTISYENEIDTSNNTPVVTEPILLNNKVIMVGYNSRSNNSLYI